MNLNRIRLFRIVENHSNLTKASRVLHVSQSSLSISWLCYRKIMALGSTTRLATASRSLQRASASGRKRNLFSTGWNDWSDSLERTAKTQKTEPYGRSA